MSQRLNLDEQWIRQLKKGELLFQQGTIDDRLYVLTSGCVSVEKDGRKIAELDDENAYIGEIAALTGQPRTATIRAQTDSTVLVIDDATALFTRHPDWGLKLAKVLASRLARMNELLMLLENSLANPAAQQGDTRDLMAELCSSLRKTGGDEGGIDRAHTSRTADMKVPKDLKS